MRKKNIVFILIILVGCIENPNSLSEIVNSRNNISISKHEVVDLKNELYRPGGIIMLGDSILLIRDETSKYHLVAVFLKDLKVKRIVRKGKGPHEVQLLGTLEKSPFEGFNYNDIRSSKFYNANIYNDSLIIQEKTQLTMDTGKPYYTIQTPDSFYVAIGCFLDGKYSIFDKYGSFISSVIEYPDNDKCPDNDKINNFLKGIIYQGKLLLKSDGTRILFIARNSGLMDILSVEDSNLTLYKRICYYAPKYKVVENNSISIEKDNIAGFHDAYVTDSKIYVMYSGKTYEEAKERVNYSNMILVYNWEGEFLKKIKLDKEIFTFTIDSSEKTLYAISHYPNVELLKFPIP